MYKIDLYRISLCISLSDYSFLAFQFYRNHLIVLDVLEGQTHTISLPISLKSVFLVAEDRWLLVENETNKLVQPGFLDGVISCLCLICVQEFHSWSQTWFFLFVRLAGLKKWVFKMQICCGEFAGRLLE